VAGQCIHRSTRRRPAKVFAAEEAHLLLAVPVGVAVSVDGLATTRLRVRRYCRS
jgi:hypothetical protein